MDGHALLFTDLVDSTAVVERLGDARAAASGRARPPRARPSRAATAAARSTAADGFFLLFDAAARCGAFALEYHAAMAELGLRARVGLHVGPVMLRENVDDDVARGAKPVEVEGLAKPLAARVMAIARGGQTLLTQAAREALGDALAAAAAIEATATTG